MLPRLRRFLDVKPGEGLPVLLTFLYIAIVVAAYLLAKPIRNGLFVGQYGAYALVYVYAAVPLAVSLFVAVYARVAARFGSRAVTVGTLVFFSLNVLAFWFTFQYFHFFLLPGVFYVWVNCFGIIAPVQAWSFANSIFDTRQAKRLFGLIGAGASFGAIGGGLLARSLVGAIGGTVNLMLLLAALILFAAGIVTVAIVRIKRPGPARRSRPASQPFRQTIDEIARSPYLRLIAIMVFLTAITTQWIGLQLNVMAERRFGSNVDALTRFFGTFNFSLGIVSFIVQLLITGPALRRVGVQFAILLLPLSLFAASGLTVLLPVFSIVVLAGALDQGLRFSIDKATYELLYLPLGPPIRTRVKNAIDIVVNRIADAVGAVSFGVATRGFFLIPGFQLGIRGTAAINCALLLGWAGVAWRLRGEYVRTIHDSIHRHRLDSERTSAAVLDRSATEALQDKLRADNPSDVRYALELLEAQQARTWHPALRDLLAHPEPDIRRRAVAILAASGDEDITHIVRPMLRDPDLGVRTEALLYLSRETSMDPLQQIQELGDFEDFSIRAAMVAFLASPGRTENLDAAQAILEGMARSSGPEGRRDRAEAARLIRLIPDGFVEIVAALIQDEDLEVARQAVRTARKIASEQLVPALLPALARSELTDEAAGALARLGNTVIPKIAEALADDNAPLDIRRELPAVLVRIATPQAEEVLVGALLQADNTLRYRIVASLNKLRVLHPDLRVDPSIVELLLAAEIAGHYRSYQVLGPLRAQLKDDDPVLAAMRHTMEQELERVFRLMALLLPETGLHDAYVGVRSSNPIVRANALEFLDNVLKPELRDVLVPLLDGQVTIDERIALANRLVGAPLETPEQAVSTMLSSEDPWLRSSAVYAIGVLQLRNLEPALVKFEDVADPVLRQSLRAAKRRLAGEAVGTPEDMQQPAPADMALGVGAG
jgi:AAA family ATP:ADP antiporter